ncbi:delta-lactam-biosynthetic de-N-acetylase [Desulforamulus ferrireducens]|uniref:Delta-lactam-biosynthetic de-N-acetylase n=1 Tax=Desulforamulus ferrireducens TaxID=1833852 RepID=A0A1S6IX39_9FIRM|nr:delta-lactam-biosynthetic de-N-acetylase [Desulforamulus ferrireducens]AQS59344.1 delta-lactam-biosynthetic de-N-acetylase [Desulforamulus ferrireducens]
MNKKLMVSILIVAVVFVTGAGVLMAKNKSGQEQTAQTPPQVVEAPKEVEGAKEPEKNEEPEDSIKESNKEVNSQAEENPAKPQEAAVPNTETTTTAPSGEKLSWYFMPNKQHTLPEVNARGKALLEKYRGIYHGDVTGKNLYLTFDEGYENGYTAQILDTLKEHNVKVAFFITGDYLRRNPELVKRMVNEGHIVGNHTDNHPSLAQLSEEKIHKEINSLTEAYQSVTGGSMKYLRPPMGEYSENSLKVTSEMGYRNVFWSVAITDWQPEAGSPEENKSLVMSRLHNGAVILLHAVNKANAEMLGDFIRECREQGYQFRTLDEIN